MRLCQPYANPTPLMEVPRNGPNVRALSRVVARRCERVIYNIPFSPQNLLTLHAYYHVYNLTYSFGAFLWLSHHPHTFRINEC